MRTLLRQVATFMSYTFFPGPPDAAAAEFQEARTAKRVIGPVMHAVNDNYRCTEADCPLCRTHVSSLCIRALHTHSKIAGQFVTATTLSGSCCD